jgi:hypothetical protein
VADVKPHSRDVLVLLERVHKALFSDIFLLFLKHLALSLSIHGNIIKCTVPRLVYPVAPVY